MAPSQAADTGPSRLADLSLEELGNITVTSVSREAEPLSDAAAAIYVITHDEIVRSGARTIVEMLRLAPNLQVAEINGSTFAVSARGFNSAAAAKLLVLIDGRSVYTPFFSGVFWEAQYVLPEDIDRIEVISGPGGTLWGANAVNGVINIITRPSSSTQGGFVQVGGGNLDRAGNAQFGGSLDDNLSYRAYVHRSDNLSDMTATGATAMDQWHMTQGGFRVDWALVGDLVTVQGDFYSGAEADLGSPDTAISGRNIVGRWTHDLADGSNVEVQAYIDYLARLEADIANDTLSTYDVEVKHGFSWGSRQQIVWGGEYRLMDDRFETSPTLASRVFFVPEAASLTLWNIFLQDTVELDPTLKATLGLRLERDPFSPLQALPSLRVAWKVTDSDLVWSAISRAARAPSRLDRNLYEEIGSLSILAPGDFQPEELTAYELGYRGNVSSRLTLSVSAYYNDYSYLRSAEYSPGGQFPIVFGNGLAGPTYGVEAWANFRVTDWWTLDAGASWLHKDLRFQPGSSALGGIQIAGADPTYQASLRSSMNVSDDVAVDLDLRRIGALPAPPSPAYFELGGNVAWRLSDSVKLSLTGQNLLHAHHLEFGDTGANLQVGPNGVEVGRSFFASLEWRY